MQWFRLYAEFATDPKVQVLSEAMQRRLVMLFCLQCENDTSSFTENHLKFFLGISKKELEKTKNKFLECKFIDSQWKILKWRARQHQSDSSKIRTKRYRDSSKNAASSDNVTLQDRHCDGDVTAQNRYRIDTDKKQTPLSPPMGDLCVVDEKTKLIKLLDDKFPGFSYSLVANHKVMLMMNEFVKEGVTVEDIENHIEWMNEQKEMGKPILFYKNHILKQARYRQDPICTPLPSMAAGQEKVVSRAIRERSRRMYEKERAEQDARDEMYAEIERREA